MSPSEEKLLKALVLMVDQYLADKQSGVLDSFYMTAGELALEALEEHGLVDSSKLKPRGAT